MPNEDSPEYAAWKAQRTPALAPLDNGVMLVGHAFGGSVLLKYLSGEQVATPIAERFRITAPYGGADEHWHDDDLTVPHDLAAPLPSIPRIFFYHSRDDDLVPFAHLARSAATLPQAAIRVYDGRWQHCGNDLPDVARDIPRDATPSEP